MNATERDTSKRAKAAFVDPLEVSKKYLSEISSSFRRTIKETAAKRAHRVAI